MLEMKIEGDLGKFPYAESLQQGMEIIVGEVLSGIKERAATELHNITWETWKAIYTEQTGTHGYVISPVPWSISLEFHNYPFLRKSAAYMKRKARKIIKAVLGEAFTGFGYAKYTRRFARWDKYGRP